MSTFVGPEQLAAQTAVHEGQFFWQSPSVFVSPNGTRFSLQVDTPAGTHTWRLKAFRRDNAAFTWTEADPGNGPRVGQPGVSFGLTNVDAGGYTAGSGVLNVDSVVGDPPFQGAPPFNVVVGNPAGVFFAELTVTAINTPTQFAVVPFGIDTNAPAGTAVFQRSATGNPLATPNGCPTFILNPADPRKVICAFPEDTLSMLSFCEFDMTANGGLGAFGPTTTGGPVVYGVDHVSSGRNYNDDTGAKTCVGYRASDNSLLFNFQGAFETVTGVTWIRAYFVTYNRTSLTWGTPVLMTGAGESLPFAAHGIVVDPSTKIAYATVVRPPNGLSAPNSSPYEVFCVPIEPDNTIHPRATMTSTVRQIREPLVSYPVLRPVGSTFELLVWYVGGVISPVPEFFKAFVARGMVGLAPVFTLEQVNTTDDNAPGDGSALATIGGAIGPDGNAYAFWFEGNETLTDFFYRLWYSSNTGAGRGWLPPVALFVCPADDSTDFLDLGATVSPLPGLGLGMVGQSTFITPTSPGVDGAVYFEFLIPTPPPILTLTFKGYKVYPR